MRWALRFIFLLAALLLISPFVISSLLIGQRGVLVPANVVAKDEYIVVHYASWTRNLEISLKYNPPDEYGIGFLKPKVSPEEFDSLRVGNRIDLRYLRRQDLPQFPGAKTLREMHLLPIARLANQPAFSGFTNIVDSHRVGVTIVTIIALLLLLWRWLRIPLFGWGVAVCVAAAVIISLIAEFPKPMPAPANDVRTTTGIVKSLARVEWLLRNDHQKGWQADQPIQIAGVQFVPEGRTEPVVAVDLIDDGSVNGLKPQAPITVEYEAASPRVAYIRGATRHFVRRNLQGVAVQAVAALVVLVALLKAAHLLRKSFRKLVG